MPFDDKDKRDKILIPYQAHCIGKNIFGMGWRKGDVPETYYDGYKKCYDKYAEIKKGDYIVTRLRNSRVFVGRVTTWTENTEDVLSQWFTNEDCLGDSEIEDAKAKYSIDASDEVLLRTAHITHGCRVEKWFECSNIMPSEIRGRLSQRRQPTIQKVNNYRQQILIRTMFEYASETPENSRKYSNYKVIYNEVNFARSLDYMELEDLVAFYIMKENPEYILQPSSCKVNELKYEFRFICAGKAPITCQVKNQNDIELNLYTEQTDNYTKIYLFSGLWDERKAETLQKEITDERIKIIKPSELFSTLKGNEELFVNHDYYKQQDHENLVYGKLISKLQEHNKDSKKEPTFEERTEGQHWKCKSCNRYSICKKGTEIDNEKHDCEEDVKFERVGDITFRCVRYSADFDAIIIPDWESVTNEDAEQQANEIKSLLDEP